MLVFYGVRASTIKVRRLQKTECPYCQTKDSFNATTFGKYFHIFWIPMFPLSKTTVAECTHCKKTYDELSFSREMLQSLHRANQLDPVKRPFWHRIGCAILLVPFLLFIGLFLFSLLYHTTRSSPIKIPTTIEQSPTIDSIPVN